MTTDQKAKAIALSGCIFPVGSNQKRFAHEMGRIARENPDQEITKKQDIYLALLFHQYRRQIPKTHKRLCDCSEAKAAREQMEMELEAR